MPMGEAEYIYYMLITTTKNLRNHSLSTKVQNELFIHSLGWSHWGPFFLKISLKTPLLIITYNNLDKIESGILSEI